MRRERVKLRSFGEKLKRIRTKCGLTQDKFADEMNISDKISNYYALAQNAYDAGNKQEAETYCNKIIDRAAVNA